MIYYAFLWWNDYKCIYMIHIIIVSEMPALIPDPPPPTIPFSLNFYCKITSNTLDSMKHKPKCLPFWFLLCEHQQPNCIFQMFKRVYIFLFLLQELYCDLNYPDKKIRQTPTHDIRKHWTAVSTLSGLIGSVYHDLHHWRLNQWPQIAEPKLYNWPNSPYHTQVMPN